MDLGTLASLIAILSTSLIAISRVPPRPRRWVLLLLGLPGVVLLYRWAAFRGAWAELAVSLGVGLVVRGIWWLVLGRRLPPPHEGQIRVWSKEDPF